MKARHPRDPHDALRVALPLFAHAMRQAAERGLLAERAKRPTHLGTGLTTLDTALEGGFPVGRTTLVAARPGIGATALLIGATLAATKRDVPVAYFSEYRTERQLRGRLVVQEGHVNSFRFTAGFISPEDRSALTAARERIAWHKLSLLAHKRITISEIANHLFSYHPWLVVADVRPRPPGGQLPVERFSNLLKGALHLALLARKHKVALVLRLILPQGEGAPTLRDLPGLGAIAQSFSTVVLLHREQLYVPFGEDAATVGLADAHVLRIDGHDITPRHVPLRFDHRFAGLADR